MGLDDLMNSIKSMGVQLSSNLSLAEARSYAAVATEEAVEALREETHHFADDAKTFQQFFARRYKMVVVGVVSLLVLLTLYQHYKQ